MYAAACPQYDDKQDDWDERIDMCADDNIVDGAGEEYIY